MKTKIRITLTQRMVWKREGILRTEGPVVDVRLQRPEPEPAAKRPAWWTRLARMLTPALMLAVVASAQIVLVPDRPTIVSTGGANVTVNANGRVDIAGTLGGDVISGVVELERHGDRRQSQ